MEVIESHQHESFQHSSYDAAASPSSSYHQPSNNLYTSNDFRQNTNQDHQASGAAAAAGEASTLLAAAAAAAASTITSTIANYNNETSASSASLSKSAAPLYTTTPVFASQLYDIMPSSMQYVLYDFWEMYHNPEMNKYVLFNGGPWLVSLLIGSYLYFVLKAGPKWMETRQAYDLKPYIRLYNFSMVIFNAYLFYHASPYLNYGFYCWGCNRALQPMVDESIPVVRLVLISRFFDFFDTMFFVLRKKFSHVTFLHVFHHTVVPIGFWIGIKFAFFPVCCFIPYLNLVVHVIMYSYYGLSTFGPKVQRYLWWKKYLTRLQILQFLIALLHSLQPLYFPNCTFPTIFVLGQTVGALLFLWLFISFYLQAYRRRNSTATGLPVPEGESEAAKIKEQKEQQQAVDGEDTKKVLSTSTKQQQQDNKKHQ